MPLYLRLSPGFEMELVTLHLFRNRTNIDQRNSGAHIGFITALSGIYR
jgi:hypothetical protein